MLVEIAFKMSVSSFMGLKKDENHIIILKSKV
mgnify:CR=1 FL=1